MYACHRGKKRMDICTAGALGQREESLLAAWRGDTERPSDRAELWRFLQGKSAELSQMTTGPLKEAHAEIAKLKPKVQEHITQIQKLKTKVPRLKEAQRGSKEVSGAASRVLIRMVKTRNIL